MFQTLGKKDVVTNKTIYNKEKEKGLKTVLKLKLLCNKKHN